MKSLFLSILAAIATLVPAGDEVISWDKTVHNFGDVSVADGPLSCTFTLTNNGQEPISILEVVSSCGCTDVKWTRGSIQAGQTGTVSATYKNEDGAMPFDKTLTAYISGVKKPVILRLRGVVHEKKKSLEELYGAEKLGNLGLKSRSINAGTLRQGLSSSETATVANLGKKPMKVSFTDVSDALSISIDSNPIPAGILCPGSRQPACRTVCARLAPPHSNRSGSNVFQQYMPWPHSARTACNTYS